MSKLTREEAEHDYDVQVTRVANSLRALADVVEQTGNRHRDRMPTLEEHVGRVWAATEVHNKVMGWLGQHNSHLILLWYAALRAEHATARSTPAELLDQAATALDDAAGEGVGEPGEAERWADIALRGAGVIR